MPRKRPGALRAASRPSSQPPRRWDTPPPDRIHGLSAATSLAVHRYEALSDDYYVFPGVIAYALRRYRDFLGPPGRRPRYPYLDDCDCRSCSFRDVRHARDALDVAVRELPPRARAELGRVVAALDRSYLARTLPDPLAHTRRRRGTDGWWYRRLEGCRYAQSGSI
ncbi:hypothetical protein K4B79_04420 [Streptomyces lincolnensis]|uniref:hypothetical protein n=1 Tax=Streptomyces lincolnensis TaxID=1915 RepID=UPI001E2E2BEA|nr:hypothetical protein [Streptomyces lincolnensis]MCD7437461.1 hypothetical protein [Streptomyces lincolnensis]